MFVNSFIVLFIYMNCVLNLRWSMLECLIKYKTYVYLLCFVVHLLANIVNCIFDCLGRMQFHFCHLKF